MTRALLLAAEIGDDVPARAAGQAGSVATQLSSVLATSAMSPWAFWLKRGANGRSANATEGHAPKNIPTATAIRTAIAATVRRHPRRRPARWRQGSRQLS